MSEHRAYSVLEIKSIDEAKREFEGIATTPSTDRAGDIVEPKGAKFALPLPLLMQHDATPAGSVGFITDAKVTSEGIRVKGRVESDPALPELDKAWARLKKGLVRGLSIGFKPLEREPVNPKYPYGGQRFKSWEWLELSAVVIPANQDASILSIKSLARAALGQKAAAQSPGAAGPSSNRGKPMNVIAERLAQREAQRAEKAARQQEIMAKCDDGKYETLEAADAAELDAINGEIADLDRDIGRDRAAIRAASGAKSVPTAAGVDPELAYRVRRGEAQFKSNLPAGTLFTRAVLAKARAIKAHASMTDAAEWARKTWPDTPEVGLYLKANPGTGLSGNWAEELNVVNTVEGEFLAALRPMTIIGRLNLRPSAFNVKRIVQNAGSTANWVGNAQPKPVGEGSFDTVQVDQSKIAGIVVLTDDQIMSSVIDSVEATRQDLLGQIAQFADEQFTDPAVTASAGLRPASVTNTATAIPASGPTAADLRADLYGLMGKFTAAHIPLSGIALVMNSAVATGIGLMVNALGQPEFPNLNTAGGSLTGFNVIVSDNVGTSADSLIVAIKQSEVFLAQSGGIRVDMSRDATIDMAGGSSPTYSLFQKNSVALRGEWWVSWKKARAEAVQYISNAQYAPA